MIAVAKTRDEAVGDRNAPAVGIVLPGAVSRKTRHLGAEVSTWTGSRGEFYLSPARRTSRRAPKLATKCRECPPPLRRVGSPEPAFRPAQSMGRRYTMGD